MLTQQTTSAARLLHRFRQVRAQTMGFTAPLTPEDLMVQSSPEASPVKWHLAHTSWFFETFVLSDFIAAYQPFHPDFRWLFNSYYNAVGDRPDKKLRASFSRPPLEDILAYRRHVDEAVERLLEKTPEDEALRRIVLGLEHEQQHLELIATDIKHAFFTNPLTPAYMPSAYLSPGAQVADADTRMAPPQEWMNVSPGYPHRPGVAEIGITPSVGSVEAFAFDNETPRHCVYIAPFRLATRLVTCAEYLAFLEEDGYSRPELWLSEGWDTVRAQGWEAPLYWSRATEGTPRGGAKGTLSRSGWNIFTLHGWRSLDDLSETPVCHLSFFEAEAYARWAGFRLPTEAEWEFVAAGQPPRGNLLDTGALHPTIARNAPASEPQQMFGDVWEWTSSPYTGYPGYKPLPGALGEYNGKFMSSQIILRGGSCVTPASHIRATYRNFFSPATRWQFSGLRLARDGAS